MITCKAILISAILTLSVTAVHAQTGTGSSTTPPQAPIDAGMAQPAGNADRPKVYQPANPAPDTRSAPTSSSTGIGPDNGGRPEEESKKR